MMKTELSDHNADSWKDPEIESPLTYSITRYLDGDPRPFWYYRNCPKTDPIEGRCRSRSTKVVRHRACSEMCAKCVWVMQRDYTNESVYDIERSFSSRETSPKKTPDIQSEEEEDDDDDDSASFYSVDTSMSEYEYQSCYDFTFTDIYQFNRVRRRNGSVATTEDLPQLEVIESNIPVVLPKTQKKQLEVIESNIPVVLQKPQKKQKKRRCNLFRKKKNVSKENEVKRNEVNAVNIEDGDESSQIKQKRGVLQRIKSLFCCFGG
ncbi:uncharacterized protein [Antedon mediterranea]|uniref:uncharacterized protein n=1 Tax=Antedon mediterranea TaxID=105859 RepID=UPI003AF9EBEE